MTAPQANESPSSTVFNTGLAIKYTAATIAAFMAGYMLSMSFVFPIMEKKPEEMMNSRMYFANLPVYLFPLIVLVIAHFHFRGSKTRRVAVGGMDYELATLGRRFFAFLVDVLITVGPFLAVLIIISSSLMKGFPGPGQRPDMGKFVKIFGLSMLLYIPMVLVPVAYFFYFEWKKGATFGKRLLGVRVIMENGESVTFTAAVLRTAFRFVDFTTYGLSIIAGVAGSPFYQRLGDIAAKTLVVKGQGQPVEGQQPETVSHTTPANPATSAANRKLAISLAIWGLAAVFFITAVYIVPLFFAFTNPGPLMMLPFLGLLIDIGLVIILLYAVHAIFQAKKPIGIMAGSTPMYLASFGARVGAQIIDTLLLMIPLFVMMIILMPAVSMVFFTFGKAGMALMAVVQMIIMAGAVSAFFGYFCYSEWKFGKTVGKHLMGIKVVMTDGRPLTPMAALLRNLMRLAEENLLIPAIVSMAATVRYQRLGDLSADTMVVLDIPAVVYQQAPPPPAPAGDPGPPSAPLT